MRNYTEDWNEFRKSDSNYKYKMLALEGKFTQSEKDKRLEIFFTMFNYSIKDMKNFGDVSVDGTKEVVDKLIQQKLNELLKAWMES